MSEKRYIKRDPATGEMLGHYSHWHDYATEVVEEDDPEILAWQAKKVVLEAAYMERKAKLDPEKMLARIEALEVQLNTRTLWN